MSEGIYGIYGFELDLIFRSQPLSLFRNCFKFNRAEPLECLLPHKTLKVMADREPCVKFAAKMSACDSLAAPWHP